MTIRTDPRTPVALHSRALTSAAGVTWTLRPSSGQVPALVVDQVPALVPGQVHTDLLAAGVIPDPFDGVNESALSWIGRTDWTYSGRFSWADDGHLRHELVAEGLDTVATLVLNGQYVADTYNQHRTYRFDVTELLREGDNELLVHFAAPVTAAERFSEQLGPRPHVNHHPYNAIRKMAANFGWDWGPDVATAGIWKPLEIQSWTGVRLASVRPLATVSEHGSGLLSARLELEWAGEPAGEVAVRVEVAEQVHVADVCGGQRRVTVEARLEDARLWWPRGHGEPALYDLRVAVERDGCPVDDWHGRVGFRRVELDTEADLGGNPFALSVNGRPVYARGVNWIPGDALISRMTAERYERAIRDAVEANANLIRVWGGGIYESEDFYRVCDELGVLVWQDFAFACAAYAEEDPLRGEVEAEARQAVSRLCRHPSLVIWNGGNETIWGFADWSWRAQLSGRSWGRGYYLQLLPELVARLDPRAAYSPNSPHSFGEFLHPNDPSAGTMHIWDVWNSRDYEAYREYRPRFVSEFGFQGPPAYSTLTAVVHDEPLDPDGPTMLAHQKAEDGNLKLEHGLGCHLPRWRSFDDWHWATQLNQARAVGLGVEHFRSLFPLNRGMVVWQLNDCWPAISWAAVDSAGIRKPMWHTLRRVFADRLLTFQPRDGRLVLFAHNDSATRWSARVRVTRAGTAPGGAVLATQVLQLDVAPRELAAVPLADGVVRSGDPQGEYLQARVLSAETPATGDHGGPAPAFWYFVEDPELRLHPLSALVSARLQPRPGGQRLTVTATGLVKDLTLHVDRIHPAWRVDTGMVTLAGGDQHTFDVDVDVDGGVDGMGGARQVPALDVWCSPTILASANGLVAR